jgi:GTP-binding protein LepA
MGACEGALLIVDASQGVEAQTIANAFIASDSGLEIIPVLNKIDLPVADVEKSKEEIEEIIGIDSRNAVPISAKTGQGVDLLLEEIIHMIPAPHGDDDAPLKALLFDSWFDTYLGVITLVRIKEGVLRNGMKIKLFSTGHTFEVAKVGVFSPKAVYLDELRSGEVGFIAAGMKELSEAKIGDTIIDPNNPATEPLPGYKPIKQMVFCGFYPVEATEYNLLKDSLDKLHLNDSSFTYEKDSSEALGFGFRCGFLGLLHMDVVQERLEREFNISIVTTAPSVVYKITMKDGEVMEINTPSKLPENGVEFIEEPYMRVRIHTPAEYVGNLLTLCTDKRGHQVDMICYHNNRVQLIYDLPMSEVMYDFYDTLKSISRGYASMDYEVLDYRRSKLVKLDILINGKVVDALSVIVFADNAYYKGKELVGRLRKEIKRQMYEVAIQAAIGSRIIARESVKALRKDVTAKCYGGDVSRKRKLLDKQKEGKKRMKRVGNVDIPQEAFLAVLKVK